MTLSFTDFELEMNYPNCSNDAVTILDGDNYQAPPIGSYTACVSVCVFESVDWMPMLTLSAAVGLFSPKIKVHVSF